VTIVRVFFMGRSPLLFLLMVAMLLSSCNRGRGRSRETVYVSAPQAILRDQVAAVYTKTGTVKNGERLELLDRDRRYAKVRNASGVEGWVEQRYLISQQVYDGLQKLAQDTLNAAPQANGITHNDTNIHLTPARDADHLYQLLQGSKIFLLKRATSEKQPGAFAKSKVGDAKNTPQPILEDWWLVRDLQGHAGWILGRMIDVDVPLDIAQYAEGQRIVAAFVLDKIADGDKRVPEYLILVTEPKDGMPYDYDQVRVFTWNVKRHRYETAYRERNLRGQLPVTVGHESFDKEGTLPVFTLHVKDGAGGVAERKYKLNTPIVHRVYAAGEAPQKTRR
jgi:SH3-like domain-containing protein